VTLNKLLTALCPCHQAACTRISQRAVTLSDREGNRRPGIWPCNTVFSGLTTYMCCCLAGQLLLVLPTQQCQRFEGMQLQQQPFCGHYTSQSVSASTRAGAFCWSKVLLPRALADGNKCFQIRQHRRQSSCQWYH